MIEGVFQSTPFFNQCCQLSRHDTCLIRTERLVFLFREDIRPGHNVHFHRNRVIMVRRLHMVPWIQDKTISLVEQFPPESHLIILYRQLYLEQHRSAESFDIVQDSRAGTTAPSGRIHRKMLSVQITVSEVPECKKTVRPVFLPVSVKSQKMQEYKS